MPRQLTRICSFHISRISRLLLCMLVVVVLWPADAVIAQPVPPGSDVTFHVSTPDFQLTGTGVSVPGYATNDVPGAPALPVWRTVIELPADGEWDITLTSAGDRLLDGFVQVPAVPVPDLPWPRPADWQRMIDSLTAVPMANRPDPAVYEVDAFYPASPVLPGPLQVQRGQRLLPVQVFPFQYNPVRGTLRYHPDLTITIRVAPPDHTASSIQPSTQPPTAATATNSVRIRTGTRGFYRLTYDELADAGVPVTTVDPFTFAMSYLGQPIAIQVTGEDDGRFDPDDVVIFYAEPYQGRYQTTNVYRFTFGDTEGERITTRAVTPTGTEPLVTTITQTLHVEFDREYRSGYPRPQDADHWFDLPLSPDIATGTTIVTRTYDLNLDDALTGGSLQLRATLHGGTDQTAQPDQSIAIQLNDHAVGMYQWDGVTYYTATSSAPAAWLDGTPNRISLIAAVSQLPGIEFYTVSPDWVEVDYPALAEAEDDHIYVAGVAAGANDVAVAGFSTPQVLVYDVRNPRQPVRLTTTQAVATGDTYTVHFWDANLPNPTYFLGSQAALAAPLAVEPDMPSNWRSPHHEADYIAIMHSSLAEAIAPLLDHRAAEGLRVVAVDVQDVYDEFSFGRVDPEAIRSFLTYAYHQWNGAGGSIENNPVSDPPQYVLLVGDGHYDFTGASGTTLPNLIPPYLIDVDPLLGETASDNRFVAVDGPADFMPDMAIGRIPAVTPADVTAVVDKIIGYETTAPAGAWQERVVYVADNNLDPFGDFHFYSDDMRLNWLPAPYDDRTIYYNRDYFTGQAMRTAITAGFNEEALYLQWFGHGSRFRWGSVSMFNTIDVPTLAANDSWPFTAAYTCWSGYFINLTNNAQSLGETLLLTPQRGSVADLSPSGLHIGEALLVLGQGLHQAVFRQRHERVGQAIDAAKLFYFGHSSYYYDVIDTSVLFGDPALKLRLPPVDLSSSTATVDPGQALPGEILHYTVTLQNSGTFTATDVTVTADYAELFGQVMGSTPAAVNANGVLTWTLASVPPGATVLTFDLQLMPLFPAGSTPIHAPIVVTTWGTTLVMLDAVSQVTAVPDLGDSSLVGQPTWVPPGQAVDYSFTLSNAGTAASAMTWLTTTLPAALVNVTSAHLTYNSSAHQLTWQGAVPIATPVLLSFNAVVAPSYQTCGQIIVRADLRDELGQLIPLAAAVNVAVPDVNCNHVVDVLDVQQVAARWGAVVGNLRYHPRYDLNGDDVINVFDISIVATSWH